MTHNDLFRYKKIFKKGVLQKKLQHASIFVFISPYYTITMKALFCKFQFIEPFRTTTAPVIPTKPQARGGISQLEKLRIFREIPRLPLVARDDMRFRQQLDKPEFVELSIEQHCRGDHRSPAQYLHRKYWDFQRKSYIIALRQWHFVYNTPPEPFGPTPLTSAGGEPGGGSPPLRFLLIDSSINRDLHIEI